LNRIQFIILSSLVSENANNNVNAMSIKEIIENLRSLEYTYNSFYKHTEALLAAGYVAAGLPVGNSKTYYITANGKEALEIVKRGN
jgi:DNA-binding transcriptional ArsR family regulator